VPSRGYGAMAARRRRRLRVGVPPRRTAEAGAGLAARSPPRRRLPRLRRLHGDNGVPRRPRRAAGRGGSATGDGDVRREPVVALPPPPAGRRCRAPAGGVGRALVPRRPPRGAPADARGPGRRGPARVRRARAGAATARRPAGLNALRSPGPTRPTRRRTACRSPPPPRPPPPSAVRRPAARSRRAPRPPLPDLVALAHRVRLAYCGSEVELESLINAKSGACPEDCAFCSQSARFETGVDVYAFLDLDDVVAAARSTRDAGATQFCIVVAVR